LPVSICNSGRIGHNFRTNQRISATDSAIMRLNRLPEREESGAALADQHGRGLDGQVGDSSTAAGCIVPLTLLTASRGWAADTATPSGGVQTLDENLKRVFAGGAPTGVADLRAMQSHVQKLTEQLGKYTVGVTVGQAQGSGVIISKDGFVLTAAHVAGKPNQPVVFTLNDGREVNGKTLGLNKSWDAGLMKIEEAGEYSFAEMGASEALKEGQWCLATGHPGGYQEDRGVVLRVGRVILLPNNESKAITSDCTLVGGDSGGPLFDMEGRVIGINSRIAGQLVANMHVPVSTFKETWERLNKGEAWGHYPGQEPVLGVRGKRWMPKSPCLPPLARCQGRSAGWATRPEVDGQEISFRG
jgi:S1-C subfamily serine protease